MVATPEKFLLRIPAETLRRVRHQAAVRDITVSEMFRRLILTGLIDATATIPDPTDGSNDG